MRIGIDARLVYYQAAGIGQYTLRLLNALAALETGDELVVLASRRDHTPYSLGTRVRQHALWTPPHHRAEQLALPLELLPLGLDVLHSPDFIPPLHRRCRSVITVHDLAFLVFPHLLTRESARYYGQIAQAVRSADAIIAVSACTRDDLLGRVAADPARVHVIPEAAGPAFFPVEDPRLVLQRHGIAGPYILFVSTIEPRKNLVTLVHAFARLRAAWQGDTVCPTLVVAGSRGWLDGDVFHAVENLRLGEAVRFLGRVPVEDLPALYSGATVFCLPSLYEGFGLPVLEAMACGTPVICSNASSLPEIAGDAAILVEPTDVEAWVEALGQVLASPALRAGLRARGAARAAQFSWEAAARATMAVYHEVGGR